MNLTLPEEFPWKESERQLVKKKILMFLAWCNSADHESWSPGKQCPLSCPFRAWCCPISGDTDHLTYLIKWIMEAEIE